MYVGEKKRGTEKEEEVFVSEVMLKTVQTGISLSFFPRHRGGRTKKMMRKKKASPSLTPQTGALNYSRHRKDSAIPCAATNWGRDHLSNAPWPCRDGKNEKIYERFAKKVRMLAICQGVGKKRRKKKKEFWAIGC